ncbi:MAG: hypothetical protein EOP54_28565 [Sphingobacteriales bacterium]|nr:MAG: hypothetical protein EOP54_28565 [Sphingobacteriales bacterium]
MKRVLPFFALLLLFSCNKNEIFRETLKDFPENRWKTADAQTITIIIEEDIASADINLQFSHVLDPQYTVVPLVVELTSPDGKKEMLYPYLYLKDAENKSLSDCAGDVCDLIIPIKEHVKLAKGNYKLVVKNKFEGPYLPNVLALSVSVAKSK